MSYWRSQKKIEVDNLKSVSVFFLKKHKYLESGWINGTINWSRNGVETGRINIQVGITDSEQYVRFVYIQTDQNSREEVEFDYKVSLISTICNFGGYRYWFKCPCYVNNVYCGRRVGILYLVDKYFACRHCYNLTYSSQNLSGISKVAGQVISIPKLEKLELEAKRKYYRGRLTKKYRRYLEMEWKSYRQLWIMAEMFKKRSSMTETRVKV